MRPATLASEIDAFVATQRAVCLWSVRPDYLPRTDEERLWVLTEIQRRADRDAFARAGQLKRGLSLTSGHACTDSPPTCATYASPEARDATRRFFPLVLDMARGLTLHPFDLATNKVLALVGRVSVCDWIDILTCHVRVSPLGCLAWAASGKDPGRGPRFILEEAARTAHYPAVEFDAVVFDGPRPDRAALSAPPNGSIASHAMRPMRIRARPVRLASPSSHIAAPIAWMPTGIARTVQPNGTQQPASASHGAART